MSRWIDADKRITVQFYDDEHEEWSVESMTIAEYLNRYTEEGCPSTEPKRPKTTETMMVDGEPTEIDPLSYEVGYTHGQFSDRPKGEWVAIPYEICGQGEIITDGYIWQCTNCGESKERNTPDMDYCPNCGADMRGGKE